MLEWIKRLKEHVETNEPGTLEYTQARKTDFSKPNADEKSVGSDGEDVVYVVWERYKDLDAFHRLDFLL